MTDEILVAVVGDARPRARVVAALARDEIPSFVQAASIDELAAACADRRPHIVVHLGDEHDPGPALRHLARSLPRTRLVAVVAGADRAVVGDALRAGADGVVIAADVPATLPVTVRAVWAGQTAVPIAARATIDTAPLSGREREVLDLVCTGLNNTQVAQRLCVTEHTVKSHLGSVFTKLGVHSRSEAIAAHVQGRGRFGFSPERRAWRATVNGDTA